MTTEVTPEDILRIHTRLDDMVKSQTALAISQERTATVMERMELHLDNQQKDRAATCPQNDDIDKLLATVYAIGGKTDPVGGAIVMSHRVQVMWAGGRWAAAIIVTAAVIPSLVWFFKWLGHVIAQAVAG